MSISDYCHYFNGQDTNNKRCPAVIFHGSGHQSKTHCIIKGPHKIHHTIYGRYDQEAFWIGERIFSGYFDEPPSPPDEED